MFKALTLTVLALATVSAQNDRFLPVVNATTATSTTCTQSKTAEPCGSGYCCASTSKNGGAASSATVGVCVPAEFNGIVF